MTAQTVAQTSAQTMPKLLSFNAQALSPPYRGERQSISVSIDRKLEQRTERTMDGASAKVLTELRRSSARAHGANPRPGGVPCGKSRLSGRGSPPPREIAGNRRHAQTATLAKFLEVSALKLHRISLFNTYSYIFHLLISLPN